MGKSITLFSHYSLPCTAQSPAFCSLSLPFAFPFPCRGSCAACSLSCHRRFPAYPPQYRYLTYLTLPYPPGLASPRLASPGLTWPHLGCNCFLVLCLPYRTAAYLTLAIGPHPNQGSQGIRNVPQLPTCLPRSPATLHTSPLLLALFHCLRLVWLEQQDGPGRPSSLFEVLPWEHEHKHEHDAAGSGRAGARRARRGGW